MQMKTIKVGLFQKEKGKQVIIYFLLFLLAYFRSKNVNLDFKLQYYGLTNAMHFSFILKLRKKI